jgi:hypothetical protein
MASESTGDRTFGPGEFPVLLRELARRRATGRWDVVAGGELRQLWLLSGTVRAVVSEAEDEKLGKWLVAAGLLESARMALALLRQPDGVRFGAFLVQQGLLDAGQLDSSLKALATDIVARLLMLPGGHTLVVGEILPEEAATIDVSTASLVAAAVRRVGNVADLESILPSDGYPAASEDAPLHQRGAQLLPEEAFLFSRVDGSATVSQLRRIVPLPHDAMTRSLAALVLSGMVELRSAPGSRTVTLESTNTPANIDLGPRTNGAPMTAEQQREYQEVVRLAAECRQRDLYRRLGLTPGATLNQVHERYRDLAVVYHPDRIREPHLKSLGRELAEIASAIQEAHETLTNPEKRVRYTDGLRSQTSMTPDEQSDDDRRQRARRELAQANLQRAQALIRTGDLGAAFPLLDEAVRAEPSPESLLLLAKLEQRNPMWTNRVLDHLRLAVNRDPRFTEGWLELAAFFARKGQAERQRQCLEKVLAYDPGNGEATKALAALRAKK